MSGAQIGTQSVTQVQAGIVQPTQTTDAAQIRRHAKLVDAAEQFEGMMLQELLKPMQEGKDGSFGGFGGGFGSSDDDETRDGSLDTMSSYGTEAVANAIAKHGGLGIAKQVLRQIGTYDEKTQKRS